MPLSRFTGRARQLLKSAVVRGVIPFDWAARRHHGRFRRGWPNGVPTAFSDKLQYKLIHDRRPIIRTYADKLAVRDYVREVCPSVRLPRLLGQFGSVQEMVGRIPPAPWVMKASHGSAMVLICDRPGAVAAAEVYGHARRWLQTDYAVRFWEWQYLHLPRRILFEEFLGDEGRTPDDYKLFVIHQKVRFIVVDQGRYVRHTQDCFWPDWTPVPSHIGRHPPSPVLPRKPEQLERMISIAEQLARDSDSLRIDLYCVRGDVYFGEITHSPAAGGLVFEDRKLDEQMGSYWQLPATYAALPEQHASPRPSSPAAAEDQAIPTLR